MNKPWFKSHRTTRFKSGITFVPLIAVGMLFVRDFERTFIKAPVAGAFEQVQRKDQIAFELNCMSTKRSDMPSKASACSASALLVVSVTQPRLVFPPTPIPVLSDKGPKRSSPIWRRAKAH